MRRLGVFTAIVIMSVLAVSGATPAHALTKQRLPLIAGAFDAVGFCPFTVHIQDLVQKETETDTFDAHGNLVRIDVHGDLVDRLTNTLTGTSVTFDNSGPVTITFNADGSLSIVQRGQSISGDQGVLTGHPFLIHQSGRLVSTGIPDPVTGFTNFVSQTRAGHTDDICALLA
jgi:hypothetical protein